MKGSIRLLGNLLGGLGLLICIGAGLARVAGMYFIGSAAAMTVFELGIGLMVAACLFKLHALEMA